MTVRVIRSGNSCAPIRATAAARRRHRVVGREHRSVPGDAVGDEPQPDDALLGRLDRVGRRSSSSEVQKPPTSLIASVQPSKTSGCSSTIQCEPLRAAGLLVGEEARRPRRAAVRCPVRMRWRTAASIIASMSFMSTAPRPQTQPSRSSPANGSHRPVGGVRRHDVEVSVHAQSAGRSRSAPGSRTATLTRPGSLSKAAARARPPAAGRRRTRRGRRLPGAAAVPVVAGVDPDQLLADPDDLVLGPGGGVGHGQQL